MLLTHFTIGHAYFLVVTATITLLATAAYVAYRITQYTQPTYTWPATVSLHSFTIKGIIMELRIHQGKEVPVVLGKPVKKDGSTSEIEEGTLTVEVVDENGDPTDLASWERDDQAANPDDPYTGKVVWRGAGKATLRQRGDADLGEGVETIEHDITLTLLDEEAVDFSDATVGAERDHVDQSTEGSEQA